MEDNLKIKVFSSVIWKLLEKTGTQLIQFIIQIFLARLLLPKDYGVIAIIVIFINLANIFIQSGFNVALVQKKDVTEEDFSSVFFLSFFIAIIIYIILFMSAPLIAKFYKMDILANVLRILSLILFLGVGISIQNAYIVRNMLFKRMFYSTTVSSVASGVIGIVLAYNNFGVWALVFQQLINQTLIFIILFYLVPWRLRFTFVFGRIRELFSFGWKLLVSSIIDTFYNEMTNLIVGKKYAASTLGFYTRGNQFPNLIVSNFNGAIQSVLFPALVSFQNDRVRLKNIMRRSIVTTSYIVIPAMVGLAIVGEPLIKLILTDKWLPSVPYLRIFCFSYALWPIHTANLQAINAVGRSDIFLKLEITKKIVGVSIILFTCQYSPYAMAVGVLISGIISSFINSYPNKKLLNYSYFEQLKDIYPSFMISIAMAGAIYFINFLNISTILILTFQILGGIFVYVSVSYLFKVEGFMYILGILKIFKKRV